MFTTRTILAIAALPLLTAAAAPATAADPSAETVRASVSYADLDLSSEAGIKAFNHRVSVTAGRMCRIRNENPLVVMSAERDCRRSVAVNARPMVEEAIATVQRRERLASAR